MKRDANRAIQEALRRRRRKQIMNVLEICLGDLVAMDGIPAVRKVLAGFQEQLDLF